MAKSIWIFIFSTLILKGAILHAQDKFLLLDGKTRTGNYKEIKDNIIFYDITKHDKTKTKYFSTLDVFSIIRSNGDEMLLYKRDTTKGFYLSVEEMRRYIGGASLAQDHYKSPYAAPFGIVAGSAGIYTAVYGFNISPAYALAVPVGYVIVASVLYPHAKAKKYYPRDRLDDYLYKAGFNDIARKKKAMSAIKGSLIGMGIYAIYTVAISIK